MASNSRSDPVYIDLAFSIPVPPADPGDRPERWASGVMDFSRGHQRRRPQAQARRDPHVPILGKLKTFARWLADRGLQESGLLVGGTRTARNDTVVRGDSGRDLRGVPGPEPGSRGNALRGARVPRLPISCGPWRRRTSSSPTRYHNLIWRASCCPAKQCLSALRWRKETRRSWRDMGSSRLLSASSIPLDIDQLIKQFTRPGRGQAAQVGGRVITERNARSTGERVERQFRPSCVGRALPVAGSEGPRSPGSGDRGPFSLSLSAHAESRA